MIRESLAKREAEVQNGFRLRVFRFFALADVSLRTPHPVQAAVNDHTSHAVREVLGLAVSISLFRFDVRDAVARFDD